MLFLPAGAAAVLHADRAGDEQLGQELRAGVCGGQPCHGRSRGLFLLPAGAPGAHGQPLGAGSGAVPSAGRAVPGGHHGLPQPVPGAPGRGQPPRPAATAGLRRLQLRGGVLRCCGQAEPSGHAGR